MHEADVFHHNFHIDSTAQNELAGRGVGICEDLITLKIKSSTVCDLSLIDLPGIARVPVPGQPEDIEAQVSLELITFWSFSSRLAWLSRTVVHHNSPPF